MRNTAGQVVDDLVSAGLLDPRRSPDAARVVEHSLAEARAVRRPPKTRTGLVEIAAYVGAALVVAAIGLFLAQEWEGFSDTAQVVTLAVIAILLAAAGLVVARVGGGYAELRSGADDVRRRLTSVLLTAAAGAAGFAVGEQVSALRPEAIDEWPLMAGSLTVLVLAAIAYAYVASAVGLLALTVSVLTLVLNGWNLVWETWPSTVGPGLTLVLVGVGGAVATEVGWLREPTLGRLVGAALALFGAQMTMFEGGYAGLAYALTVALAVAAFVAYLRLASWPYLAAGVVAVTLVVPEMVLDWTDGALGPAGAVLVTGLTLLGASLAGLRMRQEAGEQPPK